MKSGFCLARFVVVALTMMLLAACLLKSTPSSVRYFILAPISGGASPAPDGTVVLAVPLSIGIGPVKMPSYLLRSSLAIRNGENEIEYLEGAQWGERLDQSFPRTVRANLSRLLSTDNVFYGDWGVNEVTLRVYINVQQFEVDAQGQGTLIAHWRVTAAESDATLKSGTARLERAGASPHGNSGVIAATLSDLTADFSRELAQSIRGQAMSGPSPPSKGIRE
jgi:uncharacterized lipoprotein YmbA